MESSRDQLSSPYPVSAGLVWLADNLTSREGNPDMVNTINPADAKPGEVYEGTVRGERRVLVRRDDDFELQWESLSEVHDHEDVSDLARLVPARPVTRDDLPNEDRLADMLRAIFAGYIVESGKSLLPGSELRRFLDAVIEHLNASGGVPVSREDAALADRLERQAASIARLQGELETAERDRSSWRRAHGLVEQERITARATVASLCEKLAEYSARAEAAKASTAVTREDVERVVGDVLSTWYDSEDMVDALCRLFAIEAGQDTDPVEEKARELARAGGIDFDEQEPGGVEMLIGMARHVLGQEGRHVDQ